MSIRSCSYLVIALCFSAAVILLSGIDFLPQLNIQPVKQAWQWNGRNADDAVQFASLNKQASDMQREQQMPIVLPYYTRKKIPADADVLAYSFLINADHSYHCAQTAIIENLAKPCVSIFFPQLHQGAIVILNGKRIVSVAMMALETRYRWIDPVTIDLPQEAMHRDGTPDVLTIIQPNIDTTVVIPTPFYGKPEDVSLLHSLMYFLGITLCNANNVFCLLFGVLMLRVWFASRSETVFLYAGGAACFWALLFIFGNWAALPSPLHSFWRSLVYLCLAGLSLSATMYILTYINSRPPKKLLISLLLFGLVPPVVILWMGIKSEPYLDLYWGLPYYGLYAFAFYKLLRYSLTTSKGVRGFLMLVCTVALLVIVHDYAVSIGAFFNKPYLFEKWSWAILLVEPIFFSQVALPIILFLMLGVLLRQYCEKLTLIQTANQRLEQALKRREAELEVGYQQRNRLLKDESARMERERIYQDVHDGLGSVLVAAIFRVKSGEFDRASIVSLLQDCIDNMRRIVNGLADETESVQSMLFGYCMQVESFLQVSKIQIHYDISTGPEICLLRNVQTNLFRCVQEAVSNALKHANCNHLYISLNQTDTHLHLLIRDDGCGFVLKEKLDNTNASQWDPQIRAGLGLPGIRNRVRRIGGQLKFESVPNFGTMITIDLPLSQPATRPELTSNVDQTLNWLTYTP